MVLKKSHSDNEQKEENRDRPAIRLLLSFFNLLLNFLLLLKLLLSLYSLFLFFYVDLLLPLLPLLVLYFLFAFFILFLLLFYPFQLFSFFIGEICQLIPFLNGLIFWEVVGVGEVVVECGFLFAIDFFRISFLLLIVLLKGLHPEGGFFLLFELLIVFVLFLVLFGGHCCE